MKSKKDQSLDIKFNNLNHQPQNIGQLIRVLSTVPPELELRMPMLCFSTVGEAIRQMANLDPTTSIRLTDNPHDDFGVLVTWYNCGHDHEHIGLEEV